MKKFLLLLSVFVLFGCKSLTALDEYRDSIYAERAAGHELYFGDFHEILTAYDISPWVMSHIVYVADEEDSWDNPEEVLLRGYGDCDDFTILVMNIAYVVFGIEFDLVLVDTEKVRTIEEGGVINHASIAIGEYVYDVYNFNQTSVDVPIAFRFTFWEVFDRTTELKNVF